MREARDEREQDATCDFWLGSRIVVLIQVNGKGTALSGVSDSWEVYPPLSMTLRALWCYLLFPFFLHLILSNENPFCRRNESLKMLGDSHIENL